MREELRRLLTAAGRPPAVADDVEIRGSDPVWPTQFRIGEAAALALGACGAVAAQCWELRTGRRQQVRVDVGAAAASLLSFAFQRIEGADSPAFDRNNITDFYAAREGRFVMVHGGFPHLQAGALEVLGIPADAAEPKRAVAEAIADWDAQVLEDAIAARGLCGARVRSESEWRAEPQGRAIAVLPVVEVTRVGDSPPEPFPSAGDRPLSGLRALDLTRVLAGPTCGRTLAQHGAEVLKINSPSLPSIPFFVLDTGHGKRSAFLDLRDAKDAERLRELVRSADVFTQGYRGGAMERLGLDAASLHALRPGLVHTSINCYGHVGPWCNRPGWEQLAQTVTGIALENGDGTPRLLPAAATDYTTGYLAAFGTLAALERRAEEGGSYTVRVSLAQTGMWIQGLGRTEAPGAGVTGELLEPLLTSTDLEEGRLRHLGPVLELSLTPSVWRQPTVPLGTHPAAWRGGDS